MAARGDDPKHRHLRARIAQEAARLLAESGSDDVAWARRKAAAALGVRDEASLPTGAEVGAALRERRALFGRPVDADAVHVRRAAAVEAMEYFAAFEPRAATATLADDAAADGPVRLYLHDDDPDAVARLVIDRGIPARQRTRAVRLERGRSTDVPAWTFDAGGIAFELLQLPLSALRQAPRDALDDRPIERASIAAVRRLLDPDA